MVQVMHVLLKHMILDVQTAQLLHVHELMQEAHISEFQARAVLIAREEEWVTFDASLRVPGAAPPSSLAPPPHRGGGELEEQCPGLERRCQRPQHPVALRWWRCILQGPLPVGATPGLLNSERDLRECTTWTSCCSAECRAAQHQMLSVSRAR